MWIVILEMFLWTHPIGRKTFGTKKEVAESSKVLAANQGLYNGFLNFGPRGDQLQKSNFLHFF